MAMTWLRHNAVPLGALLALAVGFTIGVAGDTASRLVHSEIPDTIVATDRDAPVTLGDVTLSKFTSGSMTASDVAPFPVPRDAHIVAIGFHGAISAVSNDQFRCQQITLRELTGAERTYSSAALALRWELDPYLPNCNLPEKLPREIGTTFDGFVPFVVPEDSQGPYLLLLSDGFGSASVAVTVDADWVESGED